MHLRKAEKERRLRVMAKAKVEMLLGVYDWPDKRPQLKPDGSPNVSNRELLRVGEYSPTYKRPQMTLFNDPYFLASVKTEMVRREKKHSALVPYDPNRVAAIRDLLFDELESRLRGEPELFTRSELLQYAEKYENLSRQNPPSSGNKHVDDKKMQQFNAFISRTVNVMNENERETFVQTAADAADDRVAQIKQLIDEANVVEADADDTDVIDAEISPVEG